MLTLEDWATLESSVVQPSRLLDAVLTDLYGPRRCVTSGVFPAVLLFGHPGYVRAVNAIEVPGRNQFFYTWLCHQPEPVRELYCQSGLAAGTGGSRVCAGRPSGRRARCS
nr:circularly permuted type 2 ATP-grasp protein [Mycobacterium leprae]